LQLKLAGVVSSSLILWSPSSQPEGNVFASSSENKAVCCLNSSERLTSCLPCSSHITVGHFNGCVCLFDLHQAFLYFYRSYSQPWGFSGDSCDVDFVTCFFDPLLCTYDDVVSDCLDFDLGAFELVVGPINVWVKSLEPRVA